MPSLIILLSPSIQEHIFVDILFMKYAFGILEIIQLGTCDWQLKSEENKNFDKFQHKIAWIYFATLLYKCVVYVT